tara:strand:- start:65 stop:517 length:453 start_codon:yes stop_codon:yes gene_type:complete
MPVVKFEVKKLQEIDSKTLHNIFLLRAEVFIVEQECIYQDIDGKDLKSIHIIGKKNQEIVAYSRIMNLKNDFCSIGRVLVKKDSRKKGLGKKLMRKSIEEAAKEYRKRKIKISAQEYLRKFYTEIGFKHTGKSYLEDGIPHIEMIFNFSV